jgi:hypothetical protein
MQSMNKYNSMFDVAFSIDHDCDDPYDIPVAKLIDAMQERVNELRKLGGESIEAFGLCDTYEHQEMQELFNELSFREDKYE